MSHPSRRRLLQATGALGLANLTGCVGSVIQDNPGDGTAQDAALDTNDGGGDNPDAEDDDDETDGGPPVVDRDLVLDYSREELADAAMSGGPPPDGIPAIEAPSFDEADDPSTVLDPEHPVFGVELNGDARAYPQYILVWHEIVNDVVGDEPVSVTYCPLTGTAQGFYRGETTFGVSGQLINTNLVMFDRETESWWPQMLATAITGDHRGDWLEEFQVTWTTWERWRDVHPDTLVLTENTGHASNYGRDPYGSYNPPSGYYEEGSLMFPVLEEDDRFHRKDVVIGARSSAGSLCVHKDSLRDAELLVGELDGTEYVAVYDPPLDTGYVYRNPEDASIEVDDGEVFVDDSGYDPANLPLDREIAYDAMWVAWYGYYPETIVLE